MTRLGFHHTKVSPASSQHVMFSWIVLAIFQIIDSILAIPLYLTCSRHMNTIVSDVFYAGEHLYLACSRHVNTIASDVFYACEYYRTLLVPCMWRFHCSRFCTPCSVCLFFRPNCSMLVFLRYSLPACHAENTKAVQHVGHRQRPGMCVI